MKIVAIIQARMGSSRLPGKVLKHLSGRTVLEHVIHRVKAVSGINETVVATTTLRNDEPIMALAEDCDVRCFRGSESDVLSRYFHAASEARAEAVIRITSDCPLLDPSVVSAMLEHFLERVRSVDSVDYLSNTLTRTYPRGLDAEIFTFEALAEAHREASKPYEREHVTPFLYQHPERFRLAQWLHERDLSSHRWTLDTPEDWALISQIYEELDSNGGIFSTASVLELLAAKPELLQLNAHVEQKKLESNA